LPISLSITVGTDTTQRDADHLQKALGNLFPFIGMTYGFTPALRRIVIIGHQFVKADWNKFKPTKAVNRYQYGLTQ